MPRGRRNAVAPAQPAQLLAPLNDRIKTGEQQYVAVATKPVELALESYEHLAQLVEDGAGREGDVLREALAVGLRGMLKFRTGTVQQNEIEDHVTELEDEDALRPPPLPANAVVLRPSELRKRVQLGDVIDGNA